MDRLAIPTKCCKTTCKGGYLCLVWHREENTHQNAKFTTPSEEGNLGVVGMWDSTSGLGHELAKNSLEVTSVKLYFNCTNSFKESVGNSTMKCPVILVRR